MRTCRPLSKQVSKGAATRRCSTSMASRGTHQVLRSDGSSATGEAVRPPNSNPPNAVLYVARAMVRLSLYLSVAAQTTQTPQARVSTQKRKARHAHNRVLGGCCARQECDDNSGNAEGGRVHADGEHHWA